VYNASKVFFILILRVIGEPLRDMENCVNECQRRADLTIERLIKTVLKCQVDFDCYYNELHEVVKVLYPCLMKCMQ
jgi:hypothetical protein